MQQSKIKVTYHLKFDGAKQNRPDWTSDAQVDPTRLIGVDSARSVRTTKETAQVLEYLWRCSEWRDRRLTGDALTQLNCRYTTL